MSETPGDARTMPRVVYSLIADQTYQAVRDSICSGRFRPGDQLIEARLADELGISRGPVREALKRLRQEGLVVHRPHQGTFVRELTARDVVAMYDVRVALESVAIRLLTKRGEVPDRLENVLSDMRRAAAVGDNEELMELGFEFHRCLCAESANEFVLGFFDVISAQLRLVLALDTVGYLRHAELADYVDSHAKVLDAIRGGDEFEAATILERHVMENLGALIGELADGSELEGLRTQVLGPAGRIFNSVDI